MGDRIRIKAEQSEVGAQIGVVRGDVSVGTPSPATRDLEELLEEIRRELRAARDAGRIAAADAEAADQELAAASKALPVTDPTSKGRFVIALKKAKGLVEDLAGLTQKVVAAIAAVHGLS